MSITAVKRLKVLGHLSTTNMNAAVGGNSPRYLRRDLDRYITKIVAEKKIKEGKV